ncbi:unnamed protein product [Blepharisma stoltei]|uniref:Major facilitator superfamily (MFS) profile domain-containing protein n=1 Tax=Blepharisma stoltei TaxID=1481888 RepID=A0AAU9JIQ8_9CILI|nr:unnamed protein product [Blepharisma stoltei]
MKSAAEKCLEEIGWGKYQNFLFICGCEAIGIGVGASMLIPLIIVELTDISNASKGLLATVMNLGMLIGSWYFGKKADQGGRISYFRQSSYILLLGLTILFLSNTYLAFLAALFFIGCGFGSDNALINSLLIESIPASGRKSLAWLLGSINVSNCAIFVIAAVVEVFKVTFISDWRLVAGIFIIIRVIFIYLRNFLEEGPVFLCKQGKNEEMKKVLKKIADMNGMKDFDPELLEIVEKLPASGPAISDLFKVPLSSITFKLIPLFFFTFLGFQGIIMFLPKIIVTETKLQKFTLIAFLQIIGLLGRFLAAKLIDTNLGRKYTTVLSQFLLAATAFGFAFANGFMQNLIVNFVFSISLSMMMAAQNVISAESYPPFNRSLSIGVLMSVGSVGGMLSSVILGAFIDNFGVSIAMIYSSSVFVLAGMVASRLKETREVHKQS